MDADVVPGSVTDWTVTIDDQRWLKRAVARARWTSSHFWFGVVMIPSFGVGFFLWAFSVSTAYLPFDIEVTLAVMVAFGVLVVAGGALAERRRVEREFPVGAAFTSWATKSGLGVRTPSRVACYPWSRLTQVDRGAALVRSRQAVGRFAPAAPTSVLAGPEEPSRSLNFPVQLIGQGVAREMALDRSRDRAEEPLQGTAVVIDPALHRRLRRGWLRQQMGMLLWVFPAVAVLQGTINLIDGSYRVALFWLTLLLLNAVSLRRIAASQISAMYPVGATVVGSVGASVVIHGPWGSVAWHRGWLRRGRESEYTVAYEVVQGPHGRKASLDKRILVVPRAFLDAPAPALSTEV